MTKQRGNILFLILLAVVLFAALSYAVTSSTRGGGNDVSTEKAQANAARYLQFTTLIENTVTRMLLSGVKESEISFGGTSNYKSPNDGQWCWNSNPNCLTASCKVFDPAGGGATPMMFEDIGVRHPGYNVGANYYPKPGHIYIRQGAIYNVGTDAPDLIFSIMGVDAATCNEVNKRMGITTNFTSTTGNVETSGTSSPELFAGCGANYYGFTSTRVFGDNDTRFAGQRTFCAPLDEPGYLSINQVIIAR